MKIGKKEFDLRHRTYVMGILNITPDSFSDGGRFFQCDQALKRAEAMIAEGADLIDIGGESTRPGYRQIPLEEEIRRIVPVIERIRKELDPVISVDTYRSQVAEAALEAGADMLNDIWGFQYDPRMAKVAADHQVPCCLTHNRAQARYGNFMEEVLEDLKHIVSEARKAGVPADRIILDPGVGFGKTYDQNLLVLREIRRIRELGYPVLLGVSRKSVIGQTLDVPVEQRLEGTLAATVYGVTNGCSFVRVHEVMENKRAIAMTEAILYENADQGEER